MKIRKREIKTFHQNVTLKRKGSFYDRRKREERVIGSDDGFWKVGYIH